MGRFTLYPTKFCCWDLYKATLLFIYGFSTSGFYSIMQVPFWFRYGISQPRHNNSISCEIILLDHIALESWHSGGEKGPRVRVRRLSRSFPSHFLALNDRYSADRGKNTSYRRPTLRPCFVFNPNKGRPGSPSSVSLCSSAQTHENEVIRWPGPLQLSGM